MAFSDRFTVVRVLAERGPVTTRLVRDETGRQFVLKTLSVKRARDTREIEHFEREAGVLRHLRHPAIPAFVDFAVEDDPRDGGDVKLHLLQTFVEGKNLAQWVRDGRGFTEAEVTRILRDLADVLATLHATSPPLVHRDIKPQNVMLDETGVVFLVDFGAARRATLDGTVTGTFGTMAPEQAEGRAVPASDVFAVGMTMIFLLTHKDPAAFADDGGVRKAWRKNAHVSAALADLLDECIALDDAARPRDGAALRARVDALKDPVKSAPAPPTRSGPAVVAALVALCVVAGVGFGMLAKRAAPRLPPALVERLPTTSTTPPVPPTTPLTPQKVPASVRLGAPGVLEISQCLARARRGLQSEERYRSWRPPTGDAVPTCREPHLHYGLYALYDDAPTACADAAAAATTSPDLAEAAQAMATTLSTLTPLVKQASSYYDAEDWMDDDCSLARELHPRLLHGFAALRAAYAQALTGRARLLRGSALPDDEAMVPYRKVIDAAIAVADPALPFSDRKAAVDRYLAAVAALPDELVTIGVDADGLKKWARGSNDLWAQMSSANIDSAVAQAIEMHLRFR